MPGLRRKTSLLVWQAPKQKSTCAWFLSLCEAISGQLVLVFRKDGVLVASFIETVNCLMPFVTYEAQRHRAYAELVCPIRGNKNARKETSPKRATRFNRAYSFAAEKNRRSFNWSSAIITESILFPSAALMTAKNQIGFGKPSSAPTV